MASILKSTDQFVSPNTVIELKQIMFSISAVVASKLAPSNNKSTLWQIFPGIVRCLLIWRTRIVIVVPLIVAGKIQSEVVSDY